MTEFKPFTNSRHMFPRKEEAMTAGKPFARVDGEEKVGFWVRAGEYTGIVYSFRAGAEKEQRALNAAHQSALEEAVKAPYKNAGALADEMFDPIIGDAIRRLGESK